MSIYELFMHSSLAFPGIDPHNTPGDFFSPSNKNLLNRRGIGHKIHARCPLPRAKKPEYPPSALYLYSHNKYHDLSIFNHISVYFFFFYALLPLILTRYL